MSRLKRLGVSGTIALAFPGLAFGLVEIMERSSEDITPIVHACAAELGEVALEVETLPVACRRLEGRFDRRVTTEKIVSGDRPSVRSVEIVDETETYIAPSAEEFIEENTQNNIPLERKVKVGGSAAIIGFGMVFGCLELDAAARKRQAQQLNAPTEQS